MTLSAAAWLYFSFPRACDRDDGSLSGLEGPATFASLLTERTLLGRCLFVGLELKGSQRT
jgi:hypothetical protein